MTKNIHCHYGLDKERRNAISAEGCSQMWVTNGGESWGSSEKRMHKVVECRSNISVSRHRRKREVKRERRDLKPC